MKEIGESLRSLRKVARMSAKDLASRLSVTQSAVSNWENDYADPPPTQLCAMADLFGVSVDHLLGRKPRSPSVTQTVGEATHSTVSQSVGGGEDAERRLNLTRRLLDENARLVEENGRLVRILESFAARAVSR